MLIRLALFTLLVAPVSIVQASQASLDELRVQCEEAREARLAPLREREIQKCIAEKQKTPEECERFYSTYGNGGRTAAGGYRQPMFNDIPECQKLQEAEKQWRDSGERAKP